MLEFAEALESGIRLRQTPNGKQLGHAVRGCPAPQFAAPASRPAGFCDRCKAGRSLQDRFASFHSDQSNNASKEVKVLPTFCSGLDAVARNRPRAAAVGLRKFQIGASFVPRQSGGGRWKLGRLAGLGGLAATKSSTGHLAAHDSRRGYDACQRWYLLKPGLSLAASLQQLLGPLNEDWIATDPDRSLDIPSVREPLVKPQPPHVPAAVPLPADVPLAPEMMGHSQDPPLNLPPTIFELGEPLRAGSLPCHGAAPP